MVAGAFAGWLAVYQGAGLWGGVLVAAATGALFGALHALLTVGLALSQHVSGLGITLLATSLASYGYRVGLSQGGQPAHPSSPLRRWPGCPVPVLNQQTMLTLLALALVPLLAWLLNRTPLGLALRMVGENPAAAEGQGLSVSRLRSGAVIAGSALMGVAGAFLTLSAFNAFYFNMVNGRGWVCVALVVFASWRPGKALLGALLFAFFDAAATAAAAGRRCRWRRPVRPGPALPAVPDAALCHGHRRPGAGGPPRGLPAGADEALPVG